MSRPSSRTKLPGEKPQRKEPECDCGPRPGNIHLPGSHRAEEAKMMRRMGLMPRLMRTVRARCQRRAEQQERQQPGKSCLQNPAKTGLTVPVHSFIIACLMPTR